MKEAILKAFQEPVGGYSFRQIIDNLTDDQIIETIEDIVKDQMPQCDYWEKRCALAENYISLSPCDPDIYEEQFEAYKEWNKFKELPEPPKEK